jgi:hypothetical protein
MCGIVGAVTHTPVNQLLYDSLLLRGTAVRRQPAS